RAAALIMTGSGAEALALKLLSLEYTAAMGRPITVDAVLAGRATEAVPSDKIALPTIVLLDVSTNWTAPVGLPAPGAAGDTDPVTSNCPEASVRDTAVLVEAGAIVMASVRLNEVQVRSPL